MTIETSGWYAAGIDDVSGLGSSYLRMLRNDNLASIVFAPERAGRLNPQGSRKVGVEGLLGQISTPSRQPDRGIRGCESYLSFISDQEVVASPYGLMLAFSYIVGPTSAFRDWCP